MGTVRGKKGKLKELGMEGCRWREIGRIADSKTGKNGENERQDEVEEK